MLILKISLKNCYSFFKLALKQNQTKRSSTPMRTLKSLFVLLLIGVFLACDTDQDDIALSTAEAEQLNVMVKSGSWHISEFILDDDNNTAEYANYEFVFNENSKLAAEAKGESLSGTWRVSNDSGSEYDSYYDVDFNIFFDSSTKFGELTNNYDVISATNSEIKLNLQDNPSGKTAILVFSKN